MSSSSVVCRLLGGSGHAVPHAPQKPRRVPALCAPQHPSKGVVVVRCFVPLPLAA
jgi:hypothetical protein